VDAVILAGGAGRRLGGADKPALLVGGRSLLDRVLDAVTGAAVVGVVLVGPERNTSRPVVSVLEDPPGGGPAAAVAAGLPHVSSPTVAVLAADLPFLTAEVLLLLESRLGPEDDGALLVDGDGRDQLLAGVWRTASLRRAVAAAGPPEGLALRKVVATLTVVRVGVPTGVRHPWQDCDTPEDLRRAEELA
jgi:molybdopterin-guanine dinucleotide biosynthesis protein A